MGRASVRSWILRASWLVLALAAPWQPLADHGHAVNVVIIAWAWTLWSLAMVATVVMLPVGLTVLRIIAPTFVVASVLATMPSLADTTNVTWIAVAASVVSLWMVLSTDVVSDMVQGSAYGDEVRMPLRTPVPYMAPSFLVWATTVAAPITASLLLAAHRWIPGLVVLVIAILLLSVVPRRLHRLARRWLVFVPAGIVVHDHLVLGESFMLRNSSIASVTTTHQPGEEADLTGGIAGARLVIALNQADKVVVSPITAKTLGTTEGLHVQSFAVAPRALEHALNKLKR